MVIIPDDLVVGNRYAVEISDCCVRGHFTATVMAIHYDEIEPDEYDSIEFDNGVMLTYALGVEMIEV